MGDGLGSTSSFGDLEGRLPKVRHQPQNVEEEICWKSMSSHHFLGPVGGKNEFHHYFFLGVKIIIQKEPPCF